MKFYNNDIDQYTGIIGAGVSIGFLGYSDIIPKEYT